MQHSSTYRSLTVAVALGIGAAPVQAQLTLGDALRRADRAAYANRIAAGNAEAQRAKTLVPLKAILPSVRFEAGFIRTTDPIGVFGSTLRQRDVTQANFEPQRLNYPAPIANYQSGVVLEQPLFNADAWTEEPPRRTRPTRRVPPRSGPGCRRAPTSCVRTMAPSSRASAWPRCRRRRGPRMRTSRRPNPWCGRDS